MALYGRLYFVPAVMRVSGLIGANARVVSKGGRMAHLYFLKRILELLGQVFDVVRWPILNVHTKVQTHA